MGSWGTGLYSDDFALDLRSDISGIARLPIDGEQILKLLRDAHTNAADNPSNEEYARFWLVLADQFQKRGIECDAVTTKALNIIESDADRAAMHALGMSESDLRKRAVGIAELRARLTAASSKRRSRTLKKPQDLIMHAGEIYAYPTSGGEPFNPYVTPASKFVYEWAQDGWGAMLIVRSELAYGYLAWYCPLIVPTEFLEKPTFESLLQTAWTRCSPGTCSPSHFKRMKLDRLGTVVLGAEIVSELACSAKQAPGPRSRTYR